MHKRNHPGAEHYITDVYDVCPRMITMENVVQTLQRGPLIAKRVYRRIGAVAQPSK
ncbi:hypothetical protein [Pseudomonas gessardii]|uniref:hypothetical protein n=1 Tax=Pseudomonas gessardii TaxID=78544 RepID=UPI0018D642EB|nr:hypothetical protein [Pseudomonas gessardii]MBH3425014.1 hypothetical protein [Pseudomonas gessardii]